MSKQNSGEHLTIVARSTIKWHYTKWKLNRLIYAFQKCSRPNFAFAHTQSFAQQTFSSNINAPHIFYWLSIVAVITIACGYWNEKQHLLPRSCIYSPLPIPILFIPILCKQFYLLLIQRILILLVSLFLFPSLLTIRTSTQPIDDSQFAVYFFFLLHPIKSIYHWHCKMFVQW